MDTAIAVIESACLLQGSVRLVWVAGWLWPLQGGVIAARKYGGGVRRKVERYVYFSPMYFSSNRSDPCSYHKFRDEL